MNAAPRLRPTAGALLGALLLTVPAAAPAQAPAFVFTKLVDSNDLIPGSDGVFFQPNQNPAFDGSIAAFWNGPNLNYDSIWSIGARVAPVRLVDRNTDVPGGTGKFTNFLIDFAAPGYLVLRQGTLVFAGRDSAASGAGYSAGIWSVPAAGGAVARVANRNSSFGFSGGLQDFSLDLGRVAFHGVIPLPNNGSKEGVYAADASGANLIALADSDHPFNPGEIFPVQLFNLPSISNGVVAFYGQSVFDPSTGDNRLFTTSAAGGFGYSQVASFGSALPGNSNGNFHTRLGRPRLDGDNLYFAADDSNTNPNYFGLYRTARTGGAITRIADRNTALFGATPIQLFENYAASGSQLAFTARSTSNQYGLFIGDGTTVTKVVASGDPGPFADTYGRVEVVEMGAYSFVGGQIVARASAQFSAYGAYLITPYAQSADVFTGIAASPASPAVGASTTLTVTVYNNGPATASRPVVFLTLPSGLTFQSASSGGSPGGGVVVFNNLADLPAGTATSVTVVARVDLPGTLTASAYVNADNADSSRRNNHAFLSVPAPGARFSNYLIKKIVDTQTAIPDRADQTFSIFGGNEALPALDGGRVAFMAAETGGSAVWTANADGSGGLARIATTAADAVPGYPGETFDGFAYLRLRNGTAVFYGGTPARHNGFYAAPASGGAFRLVVNTSSPRPDRSQAFDFISSFIPGSLGDGYLTFNAQNSLYTYSVNGSTGVAAVPSGTNFPVGARPSGQTTIGGVSGTRVVFGDSRNNINSTFFEERRYETVAAALLTASPSDPAGGAFSDRFEGVDNIQVEGNTVVFRAFTELPGNLVRGLYSVTGAGAAVKLVDTLTSVPGGAGSFSDILPGGTATSYSLNGGEVVFIGADANNRLGLYSVPAVGGAIQKVVAAGDAITGRRVIQGFSQPVIQANALGQRQVVFRADFFDAATNAGGSGIYVATPASRLINLATRARVETGDNVLIGGFVVTGTGTKKVIVRAIGPSLAAFVPDTLSNPTLDIYNGQNQLIASNDDWRANQAAVQATGLAPTSDLESALVMDLPPGGYTAIVRGAGGTQGVALVEAYDLQPNGQNGSGARLINVATRARVQGGDNVLIGGLVIGEGPARRVVVRAIGPSLAAAVPGTLANPRVDLYNGQNQLIASNDDWQTALTAGLGTPAEISALGLAPTNAAESAILITLPPGAYTAIVRGQDGGSGVGLVEVYEIP